MKVKENLQEILSPYVSQISTFLKSFLKEKRENLASVNQWSGHVFSRLCQLAQGGKMLRGSLVLLHCELFGGKVTPEAIKVAASLEILHSSILVHDDIIDRDHLRRGRPTLSSQYEELARKKNLRHPFHFGTSMAICAGDLGLFLSYELLALSGLPAEVNTRVQSTLINEFLAVGLAHMEDIHYGLSDQHVSREEILSLYRYKTARYTFSLPMKLGGLLGGASEKELEALEILGEKLGIVFQIKDDEIGLTGKEKETGKPVGSDIREGKKTLLTYYLLKKAPGEEKEKVRNLLRSESLNKGDLDYLRRGIEKWGVKREIDREVKDLTGEAKKELEKLDLKEEDLHLYRELIKFNGERIK